MTGTVRFLPLAITRADEHSGCVGAVTEDGRWIRPQPVSAADVDPGRGIYRYGQWFEADVTPAADADARPEDHQLLSAVRPVGDVAAVPAEWLRSLVQPSVAVALDDERSLGLVRARLLRVYVKLSLGQKRFLRVEFCDESGEQLDWIVPEVAFGRLAWPRVHDGTLDGNWSAALLAFLERAESFVTVGLTKPNHRFPGRFRGCHPLVVGLHSVPDYRRAFAEGAS